MGRHKRKRKNKNNKEIKKQRVEELKENGKGCDNHDDNEKNQNVLFYENKFPALPAKVYIEDILRWFGNYSELECNHQYIQWLFPNRDPGLNRQAFTLNDEEAKVWKFEQYLSIKMKEESNTAVSDPTTNVRLNAMDLDILLQKIIRGTPQLKERVKEAFRMMLDFYGMNLNEENEFELTENAEERLHKLNHRTNHNFLRITRILLALKELGHANLMLPWLKFMAGLIYQDGPLAHAEESFKQFWMKTLDAEDVISLKSDLKQRFFFLRIKTPILFRKLTCFKLLSSS